MHKHEHWGEPRTWNIQTEFNWAGYDRNVAKRKSTKRPSGKRNVPSKRGWGRGEYYSFGELFMAGVGALLIVLFLGILITSLLGD